MTGPGLRNDAEAVVEDGLLKGEVILRKAIRQAAFQFDFARKSSVYTPLTRCDVDPATLHEMSGEAFAKPCVLKVH